MGILSRVKYFEIERETFIYQIITAFSFSVVFAPISFGIVAFFAFAILWEFILAGYYKLKITIFPRIAVIIASLLGFILGRFIYGDKDPFSQAKNFSLKEEMKKYTFFKS